MLRAASHRVRCGRFARGRACRRDRPRRTPQRSNIPVRGTRAAGDRRSAARKHGAGGARAGPARLRLGMLRRPHALVLFGPCAHLLPLILSFSKTEMLISIISPCRNEVGEIDAYVEAVLTQEQRGFDLEVVIADGQSDDGTRQKLDYYAQRDPRLKVIANPGRIVSTGLNLALRESRGEIVVRMDIHTIYASDYVAECVKVLRETGAACVGGPWVAKGEGLVQCAIAQAFQSRFGSGGAASRNVGYSGVVDTVYLGTWWRTNLLAIGGFDENLVRNQDDELSLRIIRGGGQVWQSSTIRSEYHPRASLVALFRQFLQYGYWKIPVIQKHRLPASLRHLVPFVFLASIVTLLIWAPFSKAAALVLLAMFIIYASVSLACAFIVRDDVWSWKSIAVTALAFGCMHAGYAVGFGRALWDFILLRRGAAIEMKGLTR